MATSLDGFLSGANAPYIAELYARFLESPTSVDQTWVSFFTDLSDDLRVVLDDLEGASWARSASSIIGHNGSVAAEELSNSVEQKPISERGLGLLSLGTNLPTMAHGLDGRAAADKVRQATQDSISAMMMVRVYRVRGHLNANFDPLGLEEKPYIQNLTLKLMASMKRIWIGRSLLIMFWEWKRRRQGKF